MRIAATAASLLPVVLVVTACVNSERAAAPTSSPAYVPAFPSTSVPASGAAASSQNAAAPVQGGPTCSADDVVVAGAFGQRPTITIPGGCTPPKQLVIKDLIKGGSDRAVQAGDHLRVNYHLVTWSDRREVDSSFAPGRSPLSIDNIGQAPLVQGWNEGLIGVKEGGRRLLIVPPDKGYGAQGKPPIKGGETLVFVVDTVEVG